jgi:lipopolysaccharide export system permease protein
MILFIKFTVVVQIFVGILSLIANTFQHTKMLNEYGIGLGTLLVYDLLKIPYLLYTTMPMTIVVSTMMVMVSLMKHNELLAYVSLGGKIRNIAIPFLFSGAIVAGLLYYSADTINPATMLKREQFYNEQIKKEKFNVSGSLTDMWLKESDNAFINISLLDPLEKSMFGVTEYRLDGNFQVETIVTYDSAVSTDKGWMIKNRKVFSMYPVPTLTEKKAESLEVRKLFNELSSLPALKPQHLSLSEIRRISGILKKQDLNTSKYELQLYRSYSHALSVMVIILVIFPLCIGFSRSHSYIAVASKSIFAGFAYWMLMASCRSLGKTGLFDPFTASFLPIALFMILSLFLIYRRERGN